MVANNLGSSNLVSRLEGTAGARMPQGCPSGTVRCLNATGSYNPGTDTNPNDTTAEINRIKHWITSGALP